MIPKNYAKTNNEQFALSVAGSLCFLMKLLTPVSFLFGRLGAWLSRITRADETPTVTQDELDEIIENIDEEGTLDQQQSELIQNALDFDETTAQDVLTARVDMVCIDVHAKPEEILNIIKSEQFSRMPVYEENTDNIIGVLYVNQVLMAPAEDPDAKLRPLLMPPCFIHKTMSLPAVLRELRSRKTHLAVVMDEYGGTLGIVTMEDLLEQLVGDIWDETDEIVEAFHPIDETHFEARGEMSLFELFEKLDLNDRDLDSEYTTAGGWAIEMLEGTPHEGDCFDYDVLTVTVKKMNDRSIELLGIEKHPPQEPEDLY